MKETVKDISSKTGSFLGGFRDFIKNYGVLPLAIGVVLGSAVNDFVKTLVDGLVTPLISLIFHGGALQSYQYNFHGAIFKFGAVLNSLLTFISIAWIVYLVVKIIIRDDELLKKK